MAGRGDCLSWAPLSEPERVCDLQSKFLSGSRTTAATPLLRWGWAVSLLWGNGSVPWQLGFFSNSWLTAQNPSPNTSQRMAVVEQVSLILYLSRDSFFPGWWTFWDVQTSSQSRSAPTFKVRREIWAPTTALPLCGVCAPGWSPCSPAQVLGSLRNESGTDPQPCPAGPGSGKTQSKSSWKLVWIQPSDELRLQKWCFILKYFLENARGFQGIDDNLYLYLRGEGNLYSSGSATTCKALWSGWGTFPQRFFLLQWKPEHRGCQSFGDRAQDWRSPKTLGIQKKNLPNTFQAYYSITPDCQAWQEQYIEFPWNIQRL